MKKNICLLLVCVASICSPTFALDLNAVFENQRKATFPDTCEMQMRTTVTLAGQPAQNVETTVVTAGENKSVTTIKSSMMQMKIVQNGSRMKVTDLKTGKALPAQNIPAQNPTDINKQMGSPEDYKSPVLEGGLWRISPKDASRPTLYYSQKQKRVVKMEVPVNGMIAESVFDYCDNSCLLPGTLKKVTIKTVASQGGESIVVLDVVNAKQRHVLPGKMFDLE